jgi:hypothetical protein
MSTRASIYFDSESGIHIYQELLDNKVYIELAIMTTEKWIRLGFPIKVQE